MSSPSPELLEEIHDTIRFLAVDAVEKASSGHPGAPMGLAPVALEIWDRHLAFDPGDPAWPLRDRFVLSAGHASMLLYALLHLYELDLPMEELQRFRQLHSRTPGHPEYGHTAGVETTTGPLGQGFAHGVGMALAARMTRARFGADPDGPGHHRVYGIVSDGDVMEGISAEAGSLAGHLGLGNLVYVYDANQITIDGPTRLALSEDVAGRFAAQGWHVEEADGLDVEGLRKALDLAEAETQRPSLIVCRTTIGYGSPNKAGTSKVHGAALGPEEVEATKRNRGWPLEPPFRVPERVRAWFAERAEAKRTARREREARLAAWRERHPDVAAEWERFRRQELPDDLAERLAEGRAEVEDATRKHSAAAIGRLAAVAPWLVGGSADLAESNNTRIEDGGDVGPAAGEGVDPFAGRNLHFGVREHAMAALTNGINLDGTFRAFAGTFLIFSDYARPAVRLAALMGVRSVFVFTHDSIFLGEDGPTHQPIEHLDALRAIPGLEVWRPCDGVETAAAWAWLAARAEGPGCLALTRQKLAPVERPEGFRVEDAWKGAYAVRQPAGEPDGVLVATGSEVALACAAAERLDSEGVAVRVVSMPCLERFARQPEAWRRALVPTERVPVVAVEASRALSFHGLVGPRGLVHGIDRFGASAPWKDLAEEYGFTPEHLAAAVRSHLETGPGTSREGGGT